MPTPTQVIVLSMMAEGKTDHDIAEALGITPNTARTHASNLLGRIGARTRAEAVAIGFRRGLIH